MLALGLVLLPVGCALLVAGILGLGDSFAVFPAPRPAVDLMTTGIYARARHPIFGGWILVGIAFGVAFSPWACRSRRRWSSNFWGRARSKSAA